MDSILDRSVNATVAVLTLNEEERIERCLASLRDSGAGEVLVIDNGSTDRTLAKVAALREGWPELRLIQTDANHLGLARQMAVEQARFPYLAFLDADCVAPAGWLRGLHEFFRDHEELRLLGVGSGNVCPESGTDFHRALRLMLSSPAGHFGSVQAQCLPVVREVPHLSTCNVFYHRERLLAAGGFSPEFDFVCEDLELSVRSRKLGWRFLYAPGLEVVHDHRTSVQAWARKMIRYGRGQVLVFRKHREHLLGRKALPLLFGVFFILSAVSNPTLFLLSAALYLGAIGALSAWLASRASALRLTPRIAMLFVATHWGYALGELGQTGIFVSGAIRARREVSTARQQ